jgi:hypothetical protein
MIKTAILALPVLLLGAAAPARADCHWAWHCDQAGACGFVPFCDSPNDRPPPLQGMLQPRPDTRPVAPPSKPRQPLPGFKPINPAPPSLPGPANSSPPRSDDKAATDPVQVVPADER